MTSHNGIFGWIHGFRLNENNAIMLSSRYSDTPFPTIIAAPTIKQAFQNWNTADTGIAIMLPLFANVFIYRAVKATTDFPMLQRRGEHMFLSIFTLAVGVYFGLRNSTYRLEGLVPNGLPAKKVYEPVKYNYTSAFLKNSVWGLFIDPKRRPNAQ